MSQKDITREQHPDLVERLLNSDDMMGGANTEDKTYRLLTVSARIFQTAV